MKLSQKINSSSWAQNTGEMKLYWFQFIHAVIIQSGERFSKLINTHTFQSSNRDHMHREVWSSRDIYIWSRDTHAPITSPIETYRSSARLCNSTPCWNGSISVQLQKCLRSLFQDSSDYRLIRWRVQVEILIQRSGTLTKVVRWGTFLFRERCWAGRGRSGDTTF